MNLEEQIEKAFKAGADFIRDNAWTEEDSDSIEIPTEKEEQEACVEYINSKVDLSY